MKKPSGSGVCRNPGGPARSAPFGTAAWSNEEGPYRSVGLWSASKRPLSRHDDPESRGDFDSTGRRWLFRPVQDRTESRNLAIEHPEIVERLTTKLQTLVEDFGLGAIDGEAVVREPESEIEDPAVREGLRSLGYVGG